MKKGKLKCPHCAEKVSFSGAFQAKANEEYFCPSCRKFSKVFLSKDIKNLARILAVLVGIVMVLFTFFVRSYLLGAAIIALLFLAFYAQVPKFIHLKK